MRTLQALTLLVATTRGQMDIFFNMLDFRANPSDIRQSEASRVIISSRFISLLPYLGLLLGMLMWLLDAIVDAYIVEPELSLMNAIFSEESTEVWMRSLILLVFTASSVLVQYFMRKQKHAEIALLQHQHHLESIVDARTKELQRIANVDSLTEIYNRNKFQQCFNSERDRSVRYKLPLSLIICDIDHFKTVNDQFGHAEGDRVLKDFALLLRENLRKSDVYARWGGEEFIVLLPHTDLSEAEIVAEKLRERATLIEYGNDQHRLSASFGVSKLNVEETSNPLIKRADEALYQAKRDGRNRVCTML